MLEKNLEKFLLNCRSRNLSDSTIVQYRTAVVYFDKFLEENGITVIDSEAVENFLADFSQHCAKTTLHGKYVALKVFFGFLKKRKYIAENPLEAITPPRKGQHSFRVFSETEISKIMGSCDKGTFVGIRNYTMFNLMLATGMRVSEICQLMISDVDWDNNWLFVRGKGDKHRFVPMTNTLRQILAKYLKRRKRYVSEHMLPIIPNLLVSRTGKKLTKDEISNTFLDIKRRIGASGARFSSHTFRHTFATLYLKNGGNVFSLQKILGHSNLNTTRIYVNLNQNDIKIQMQRFSPLDNDTWRYL